MNTDSQETRALREAVHDVLEDSLSLDTLRRLLDRGERIDEALWRNAAELGWLGLTLPEAHGGSGMGFDAQAALYEELGRYLAPLPYLSTQLCAEALVAAGSDAQRKAWLPAIAQGECIGALTSPPQALAGQTLQFSKSGATLKISGRAGGLLSPSGAKLLLVFARDEAGKLAALLLEPGRDGVALELSDAADRTRHLGAIDFSDLELPADRLLAGDARALAERLLAHASLALGCDSIGGTARIFELTIDYLKTRQQFGRAIGSFQALKHRCADQKALLEAAAATVGEAVARRGSDDAPAYASMAKFYACDAYARIAAESIQLHGGIGFTWEHYCHLFLKRAKLNQQLYGSSEWHKDRAARLLVGQEHAA
jgi:alkylation response protein AidB-like acyl-CoA dehydrogenase